MTDPADALVLVLSRLQGVFVTVSLLSIMAALGTRLAPGDVARTVRQYNLVSRWVLANLLAVPLLATLLGVVFSLPRPVVHALLLVAVAPGAPFIPQLIAMAGEDSREAVRLTAALTVVATVFVPLIVAGLLSMLQEGIGFAPWRFLVPLLAVLVTPMVAGGVLQYWRPDRANSAARVLVAVANVTLAVALAIVVLLDVRGTVRVFATLFGTGVLLVMALFVVATIAVGWLLGGPTLRNRRILALGTAGRNVNIALFIATGAFPDSDADQNIVAFAAVMLVMSLLVVWYWKRNPLSDGVEPGGKEAL